MKKRFLAFWLLLCLLPWTALADFDPSKVFAGAAVPDIKAFASAQLKEGGQQTKDYLIYRKFSGKPSTLAAVAEAYVQLLQEEYAFKLEKKITIDCGSYARIGYAFSSSSLIRPSNFSVYSNDDEPYWNSDNCNLFIQYIIPDSGTSYIHLYYSPEFTYKDQGDRYVKETGGSERVKVTQTAKPQATQKPRATEKPDTSTSATR